MPLLICLFSLFNVITSLPHHVISPFPLFLQNCAVAVMRSQSHDEAFFQSFSESHVRKRYADLRKRSRQADKYLCYSPPVVPTISPLNGALMVLVPLHCVNVVVRWTRQNAPVFWYRGSPETPEQDKHRYPPCKK